MNREWMQQAINLAKRGIGHVEPNPAVGAVIVKNNKIVGQGYHHHFGGPHAEVDAIKNAKGNLKDATLYVTLEPCCHWGKTPPCTDAIIASGIKKVFAATLDPFLLKRHDRKGVQLLRKAGIEVEVGLMATQAKNLNPWFFKKGPWIICKWAQTLDGKLAARTGHSKWISSESSRIEAHKLRQSCNAVVVGVDTAIADDPKLTVRLKKIQNQPARVVLDTNLRIPTAANLIKTAKEIPTWIITSKQTAKSKSLQAKGVNIAIMPKNKRGQIDLRAVLKFFAEKGWQRIMVEGGATLLTCFLQNKVADEIVIFQSSKFALDDQAVQLKGQTTKKVTDFLNSYEFKEAKPCENDVILHLFRRKLAISAK